MIDGILQREYDKKQKISKEVNGLYENGNADIREKLQIKGGCVKKIKTAALIEAGAFMRKILPHRCP